MFDLFREMAATPEAQADAYTWAAAFLGHVVIGLVLTGAVAAGVERAADWIDGHRVLAWLVVTVGYAVIWEGAVQHLGAGFVDALVDTVAVGIGGVIGIAAWARRGKVVAAAVMIGAGIVALGVRRRK